MFLCAHFCWRFMSNYNNFPRKYFCQQWTSPCHTNTHKKNGNCFVNKRATALCRLFKNSSLPKFMQIDVIQWIGQPCIVVGIVSYLVWQRQHNELLDCASKYSKGQRKSRLLFCHALIHLNFINRFKCMRKFDNLTQIRRIERHLLLASVLHLLEITTCENGAIQCNLQCFHLQKKRKKQAN